MTDPKQKAPLTPPPPPKDSKSHAAVPSPQGSQQTTAQTMQDLEKQVARLTDIAARAQADLQNFKMRMERDASDLRVFVQSGMLLKIIPILDDLRRAMNHAPSREGLEHILGKLEKVLSDAGAKKIEAVGKPVDPLRHEVINSGPGEKGIITAVHEEGYELSGRVLRPAKVQVGDGKNECTLEKRT